jgi:hypothetical protein
MKLVGVSNMSQKLALFQFHRFIIFAYSQPFSARRVLDLLFG